MQHTMAALWRPGKGVYMKVLDTNLYLVQFYHEIDVRRVMEGCPWSFNRRALIMARLKDGENPRSVVLNSIDLWVQIHDLKVGFMSDMILKGIGNYIGRFVDSCPSNYKGVWREYMRIRVSINVNSPLKRRMKLKMNGNEWFWANFKYENVPTFCFICGIMGHSERFCNKLFEVTEGEIIKPYGPWMRAPFKSQVKPIGAKWLRTEFVSGGVSSEMEEHGGGGGNGSDNQDPIITPGSMVVVNQGENVGKPVFQNSNAGAVKYYGNESTSMPSVTEHLNRHDVTIIESKKRRTVDGLGLEINMGQKDDILMVPNEETLSEVQHGFSEESDMSKNGYTASTHGGARLTL